MKPLEDKDRTFRIINEFLEEKGLPTMTREEFDKNLEDAANKPKDKYVCITPCSHWGGKRWEVGDIISDMEYTLHEKKGCFKKVGKVN